MLKWQHFLNAVMEPGKMNSTFSLLIVFLTQLFTPRHNAQLRLLTAQIQNLRTGIPTQRIILSPDEKTEQLRIGAKVGHGIDGLLEVARQEQYRPVMVGLQYFFQLNIAWGEVMAYLPMITVPVLGFYLALQRAFIASSTSIASTGVKG